MKQYVPVDSMFTVCQETVFLNVDSVVERAVS